MAIGSLVRMLRPVRGAEVTTSKAPKPRRVMVLCSSSRASFRTARSQSTAAVASFCVISRRFARSTATSCLFIVSPKRNGNCRRTALFGIHFY